MFTGYTKIACTWEDGISHKGCEACGGTEKVISHMDDVRSGLVKEDEVLELEIYTTCDMCEKPYRDFIPNDPARDFPIHICGICEERIGE
jgi:hypothetical protein